MQLFHRYIRESYWFCEVVYQMIGLLNFFSNLSMTKILYLLLKLKSLTLSIKGTSQKFSLLHIIIKIPIFIAKIQT